LKIDKFDLGLVPTKSRFRFEGIEIKLDAKDVVHEGWTHHFVSVANRDSNVHRCGGSEAFRSFAFLCEPLRSLRFPLSFENAKVAEVRKGRKVVIERGLMQCSGPQSSHNDSCEISFL
jgi:hypothetical protein